MEEYLAHAVSERHDFVRRVVSKPFLDVGEQKRHQKGGYGYDVVSIVRLTDIQDRPKLFSTFMLIKSSLPMNGIVSIAIRDRIHMFLFRSMNQPTM